MTSPFVLRTTGSNADEANQERAESRSPYYLDLEGLSASISRGDETRTSGNLAPSLDPAKLERFIQDERALAAWADKHLFSESSE